MDNYASVRSLPFAVLAPELGIDISKFHRTKQEWAGPCPIHHSKNNRGCFRYDDTGRFHCFSCEAKGRGAIDLAMKVKQIGFKDAVALLEPVSTSQPAETPAKEKTPAVGDSRTLQEGDKAIEAVYKPLEKDTWRKYAVPCPWLEQRVPDASVRELYSVFCYNNPQRRSLYSGRVMLPVKDVDGVLYGYLGRLILSAPQEASSAQSNPYPKYLFPKNLPKARFLFGSHEIEAGKFGPVPLRVLYLVESPFCVMRFASLGLPAVSPYGWSVSEEQCLVLSQLAKGIVYLPDRNKYDQSELSLLRIARHLWVKTPPLPSEIDDPEHLSLEQIQDLLR